MKKKLLIVLTLFMAAIAPIFAQSEEETDLESYVFVDKNGNEVPNGSVVYCNQAEEDVTGMVTVPSGLYVKNANGTSLQPIRICYNIEQMTNGTMQICFPTNCLSISRTGLGYTTSGTMAEGSEKDIQTEWLPSAYGTCKVSVQVQLMDGTDIALYGPKVYLDFSYADPTAINSVNAGQTQERHYNLAGQAIQIRQKGLHLVRSANGKVHKVMIR